MIVWGGIGISSTTALKSGGRYNPTSDSWSAMNSNGFPDFVPMMDNVFTRPSALPTAIWTGSQMIVWGQTLSNQLRKSAGARYDPVTDSWSEINTSLAPDPRAGHTAVWTGKGMLVYGGILSNSMFDPAIYYYTLAKPIYLYKRP